MKKEEILNKIRGNLIVSCQGSSDGGNSFYTAEHMLMMATAAKAGGCVGFRANTPSHVEAIKKAYPDMPMIGIWKIVKGDNPVYITPDMQAIDKLVELGSDIIAVDGTHRKNAEGKYAWELIAEAKKKYPNQLIMADIATFEDAEYSAKAGADIVSSTLSGYTENSKDKILHADFDLLKEMKEKLDVFIIAEGRIWSREDAVKAYESGADSIVVGTAITSPIGITKRYVNHINEWRNKK